MPAGEAVRVELITETTKQHERAEERRGPFVHLLVRYTLGFAPVPVVVPIDLVLKLALPQAVVAHASSALGSASFRRRRAGRIVGCLVHTVTGPACDGIVGSNGGCARVAARTR